MIQEIKHSLEKIMAVPIFQDRMVMQTETFRAMFDRDLYALEIPGKEESSIGARGMAYLAQGLADITQRCAYLSVEDVITSRGREFKQVRLWKGDKKPEMCSPHYPTEVCHIDKQGNSERGVDALVELNLDVDCDISLVIEECSAKVTDRSWNGLYASDFRGSKIYEFQPK